jgi:hypothetical protein
MPWLVFWEWFPKPWLVFWEWFPTPFTFVALFSLQGGSARPAPTGRTSSLRPDLMPAVIVLPVAHATVARRYVMVVVARVVVVIDQCGGVMNAPSPGNAMGGHASPPMGINLSELQPNQGTIDTNMVWFCAY